MTEKVSLQDREKVDLQDIVVVHVGVERNMSSEVGRRKYFLNKEDWIIYLDALEIYRERNEKVGERSVFIALPHVGITEVMLQEANSSMDEQKIVCIGREYPHWVEDNIRDITKK